MEYKFINPYNFISMSECQKKDGMESGNYSGYMNCVLTTKTPLIMVDSTSCPEERDVNGQIIKKHKKYEDIFRINGKSAIPGSELRGMIRSKFETLTNSCYSTAEETLPFVTRSKMTLKKGLLHVVDGKAELYEAKGYPIFKKKGKNNEKCFNLSSDYHITGDVIKFEVEKKGDKEICSEVSNGSHIGYFRKGEKFGKERHDFVFELMKDTPIECKDDLLELYNTTSDQFTKNFIQFNKRDGAESLHASYCKEEWRPVWWRYNEYLEEKNHVYLSLSSNGQLEYGKHLKDLLSISGKESYLPCLNMDKVCEACNVFGTEKENIAHASKVRISDAELATETNDIFEYDDEYLTLPILATPKYTNANFYLYSEDMKVKQDFNALGVDYRAKRETVDGQSVMEPSAYKDPIHIRGRKEYWHFDMELAQSQADVQNVTVKPLTTELSYSFKVYFNDLTKDQLIHLYFSICLGNDEKHSYYHKLGLGKPFGFGSVKVDVLDVQVRKREIKDKRIIQKLEPFDMSEYIKKGLFGNFTSLSSKQIGEMKAMYDFDYLSQDKYKDIIVDYPRNEPDGNIFEWFVGNPKVTLPFANEYVVLKGKNK